ASGLRWRMLMEFDERRLFLPQACSSLFAYCTERLGYSDDAALKRARVARLASRFPETLDELRAGTIHLTWLFLLSQHANEHNIVELLGEARGKGRREIEAMLAQRFPRPSAPDRIKPIGPMRDASGPELFQARADNAQNRTCPEATNLGTQGELGFANQPLS